MDDPDMPPLLARADAPPHAPSAAFLPIPESSHSRPPSSHRRRRRGHSHSYSGPASPAAGSGSAWAAWPGPAAGPGPYGGTPFADSPSLAPSDSISATGPSAPMPAPAYAAYPLAVPASYGVPAMVPRGASPSPWADYDPGTYEPRTSSSAFKHAPLHDGHGHGYGGGGGGGGGSSPWPVVAQGQTSGPWPAAQAPWGEQAASPWPAQGTSPWPEQATSLWPEQAKSPWPAAASPWPEQGHGHGHAAWPAPAQAQLAAWPAQAYPSPYDDGSLSTSSASSPPVVPSAALALAHPGTPPGQPLPAVVYQPLQYAPGPPPPAKQGRHRSYRRASSEAPVQRALDTVQKSALADVADRRFFDRPGSWRPDFRMPRTGLDVFFPPKKPKSISRAISERGPFELNAKLRHSALRDPPVNYDMRLPPTGAAYALHFRDLRRPVTHYDLQAFATEPPLPLMRLYHARLPWYIDVVASDPVGATLQDVFDTLWRFLHARIHRSDFYNNDVGEEERAKIARSFRARCGADEAEVARGVRRVDFLMRDCMFLGLAKGRDGMFEMKTRKV